MPEEKKFALREGPTEGVDLLYTETPPSAAYPKPIIDFTSVATTGRFNQDTFQTLCAFAMSEAVRRDLRVRLSDPAVRKYVQSLGGWTPYILPF